MVDAHSHLTLPGGSHWIDRAGDPTDRLLATAEDNARLLRQAGVRWARDVGAPVRDGRALSLTVRERWRGRPGDPCVRVAGGWLARTGSLPAGCRSSQRRGPAPGRRPRPARGRRRPGQAVPGRPDRDSSPLAPPTRSTSRSRPSMPAGAAVTTPSSRLPGARAAAAGSMPGARVPAGARPGPGHGRRWGRPWWRPWPCWSPGTASGRPPGWAALASAEGRAGLAERREAAQASVRSWPMGRGAALRRDRLRRRLAAVTGGGCWASPAPVSWPRGPG
jgi:hypothetical protein